MSDAHNTRNYFAHGGSELVIGGRLTFLPGACVEGADSLFDLPEGGGVAQLPVLPDSEAVHIEKRVPAAVQHPVDGDRVDAAADHINGHDDQDRKSTRLNSSHPTTSRMPSSA